MNLKRIIGFLAGLLLVSSLSISAQDRLPFLKGIRRTADTLLKIVPENNAEAYYYQITQPVYRQALSMTAQELLAEKATGNALFLQTMQQLLKKLNDGLLKEHSSAREVTPPSGFAVTCKAALQNFHRYQPPGNLTVQEEYLWTMIQVLENLNQINVGYMQAHLPEAAKASVLQRLNVQQALSAQLRSRLKN